jgi:hypothetical protein
MKHLSRPRLTSVMASLVVLLLAASFSGIAQSTGSPDEIDACVTTASGALRIVKDPANCDPANESPLSWNIQGIPGIPGPSGYEGPVGPPSSAAVSGSGLSAAVVAHLTRRLATIRSRLNRPLLGGDLGSESQQKLQMSMERISKAYETISNILKKENETEQELLENLK